MGTWNLSNACKQVRVKSLTQIPREIYHQFICQNFVKGDLPAGPVVGNPSSNSGDEDSISDQGTKIPHTTKQLKAWDATRESGLLQGRSSITKKKTNPN